MGTPRAPQGSPRLGSGRGRTNSPRSGQVLSWHCPGPRVPSQVSEDELDRPPEQTGKGRGLARMIRGTQAHKQKKWVLLVMLEECVARKAGTLSPAWEMARAPGNTHQASHAGAGGRGGRERAGSHAAGRRGTHAQSRTSPGGRGTRRREAGAGALTQPPRLERARRLQHRSAPGPCRSRV